MGSYGYYNVLTTRFSYMSHDEEFSHWYVFSFCWEIMNSNKWLWIENVHENSMYVHWSRYIMRETKALRNYWQSFRVRHHPLITHLSSVQLSHSVVFDLLQPHGLQQAILPHPSPVPGDCSRSCPLSWWCYPTISSSVVPFSSCLQSFPTSGSSPVSQFFTSGGQSIGVSASASVLPLNIQDWFPLGLIDLISL